MATDYLVQEEDGVSRILLEDGSGYLILEESTEATATSEYVNTYRRRR